jgi:major type 1 subunit fimbrin (pilin)
MQFDATADTNTTTEGVIQLTGGEGAASGVGIQVLGRGEQPVKLNTEWKDGVAAEGLYSIPFQAQYYQTQSVVRAGAANGVATFTLTYK